MEMTGLLIANRGSLHRFLTGISRAGPLHPDLVVVECSAANRSDRLGSSQHIDAATADMIFVRMDRFRDQDAAPHAFEKSCDQRSLTARIAQYDRVAICDAKRSGIKRMNHHGGRTFARLR